VKWQSGVARAVSSPIGRDRDCFDRFDERGLMGFFHHNAGLDIRISFGFDVHFLFMTSLLQHGVGYSLRPRD